MRAIVFLALTIGACATWTDLANSSTGSPSAIFATAAAVIENSSNGLRSSRTEADKVAEADVLVAFLTARNAGRPQVD
jgi:hypothetical protein